MTSQRLVEDFARWLWERDEPGHTLGVVVGDKIHPYRTPDNYLNEAAVFLAGELGQRLQHARQLEAVRALTDKWEHGALRWADPLPVPPEVALIREALDGAS